MHAQGSFAVVNTLLSRRETRKNSQSSFLLHCSFYEMLPTASNKRSIRGRNPLRSQIKDFYKVLHGREKDWRKHFLIWKYSSNTRFADLTVIRLTPSEFFFVLFTSYSSNTAFREDSPTVIKNNLRLD